MNRGAQALRKKLQKRGAKAELARALKIGPDVVSRWLSGERLPDPPMRARIADRHRIGWRLWDEDIAPDSAKAESGQEEPAA